MQMGTFVGKLIAREIMSDGTPERPRFHYVDKGTMATIGRSAAVASIAGLKFGGFPAWLAWLFVHLLFLVGFRNKLAVLIQWIYAYFTYRRGARVIFAGVTADRPTPAKNSA
jgi:NADH dehydrogenase